MKVLGLYDGHNTNAALINQGRIERAVEEERFSRFKNHDGRRDELTAPFESVKYCVKDVAGKIDAIALALETPESIQRRSINSYFDSVRDGFEKRLGCDNIRGRNVDGYELFVYPYETQRARIHKINSYLRRSGVDIDHTPIHYVNHHLAHVASVYFTSPFDNALIVTLDGKGDDLCGMVALGNKGKIEIIHEVNYLHSIGHLYSAITVACGFTAVRHEGKITGLAAYSKPDAGLMNKFYELFKIENGKWRSKLNVDNKLGPYPHTMFGENIKLVRCLTENLNREQMSATVQTFTEEMVQKFVKYYVEMCDVHNVLLAGGVFANVKVNQRIQEIDGVNQLYVHPAMSDAGLGVGAALKSYYDTHEYQGYSFDDAFFGPEYDEFEIMKALNAGGLHYSKPDDIEIVIAEMLAQGKLVARFEGRLEYGPRALGNRSILYQTTDKTVNDWLNKHLERTEFMPFAPITLFENRHECYKNCSGSEHSAQFMTITYECTEEMINKSPAVVHIDGTARPQLVSSKNNPNLYRILKHYYQLTGIPSLINTSFNVHEEPIVCSPADAVKSFLHCHFDFMQIGPFLVQPRK